MKPASARASSRRPAAIRAATATAYKPSAMRTRPQGKKGTFSGVMAAITQLVDGCGVYRPPNGPLGQLHALDLTPRHLQEARPQLAEGRGVPGADEPVGPLFVAGFRESRLLEDPLGGRRDRVAGSDQADVAAQHALEHRR